MNFQKISEYLHNQKDEMVRDCLKIISMPSVSDRKDDVKDCLKAFLEMGKGYGMKSAATPEMDAGILEIGEGKETLGILVHLDVVDPGDLRKWTRDPFDGYFDGQYIWGRGAEDNKGSVIMALYAMRALLDLKIPLKKKIQLIIGTQEEVVWTDMDNFKKHFPPPDYGFTPDGSFPIQNREKGYADLRMVFTNQAAGDFPLQLESFNSGESTNSIPSHAEVVLRFASAGDCDAFKTSAEGKGLGIKELGPDRCRVTAEGITSHSSLPEKGDNAISKLTLFLKDFPMGPGSAGDAVRFLNEKIGEDYYGRALGFYEPDPYVDGEFMHFTTAVPTVLKISPDQTVLNINMRTRYGMTEDKIRRAIDPLRREYHFTYEIHAYMDPLWVHKDKPFIRLMGEAYEEATGLKNDHILAHGTSYAKSMPNIVCWGPVFSGTPEYAHKEDERILLKTVLSAAGVYTLFLSKIATNEEAGV